MKIRLRSDQFDSLRRHLFQSGGEQHAFLLAERYGETLVVREQLLADPRRDLVKQSPVYLALGATYVVRALDQAADRRLHLIDVHSHPWEFRAVRLSALDRRTAERRFAWHGERLPTMVGASLVMGQGSISGLFRLPETQAVHPIEGMEVTGERYEWWPCSEHPEHGAAADPSRYDRQVRAFGELGQSAIGRLRVAVVGLGGTGSALVTQLAHLGVRRWILIEPDRVEPTNLNRWVGARLSDAERSRPKTEVAERLIRSLHPEAEIESHPEPFGADPSLLDRSDLVFGCTDNLDARLALARAAAERAIPYLDLGTGIVTEAGAIREAGGQVFAYWPGGPCLLCWRPGLRRRRPSRGGPRAGFGAYGAPEPQPSVVFLNSAIASLAAGEFHKYVTGWARPATALLFDGVRNAVTSLSPDRRPECPVCSPYAPEPHQEDAQAGYLGSIPAATETEDAE